MCEVCDHEDYVDVADSIINIANRIDEEVNSERGLEFADSVREKAISIKAWIQEKGHVTTAQASSLDNMLRGAERWLDNER